MSVESQIYVTNTCSSELSDDDNIVIAHTTCQLHNTTSAANNYAVCYFTTYLSIISYFFVPISSVEL